MLKLRNHGETYEMNCPRLSIRILPFPGVSWVGNVNILCKETGLVAELSYKSSFSFLGLGGNSKLVQGKILDSSSFNVLYEIDGQWDRYMLLIHFSFYLYYKFLSQFSYEISYMY